MKQYHIFISGSVQGVFFRSNTCRKANELNVKGWVKNLVDGRVEVVAQGAPVTMDAFLKFLHKGPYGARVKHVEVKEETASKKYSDFSIKQNGIF